jgi:hypothetical protein
MNEYDRVTDEWNRSALVQRRRSERISEINNTPDYYTGDRIHHLRTIQMPSSDLWNELFRYEALDPVLREYSQASIRFAEDHTHTHLFAGQMEVSLILQENYRPGVHVAIFIIQLFPHRQFYDGHVIQREFGNGSATHQTINQMFSTDDYAVVSQATEYNILEYIANDDDMRYLLHHCFMDPEFTTVQYTYVMPPPGYHEYEDGYYVVDHHRANPDRHRVHDFVPFLADAAAAAADAAAADANAEEIIIPPPPPGNNFEEIYQYHYNNNIYDDDDDDSDSDDSDDSDSDRVDKDVRG